MATDFFAKLKKRYQVKVNPSHSHAELREDFAAEIINFLESYLAALDESLEDINSRAVLFFNKRQSPATKVAGMEEGNRIHV